MWTLYVARPFTRSPSMTRYALALSLVFAASAALAQAPGRCAVGTAQATLDANQVQATFPVTGTLFYGPGLEHEYYVPKASRLSPLYAASLWVGGRVGGDLRVAGATYGQGSDGAAFEFWPGPLNDGATLPNPSDCSAYDRVWAVSSRDVLTYEQAGTATPDLRSWPVGLGAPAIDAAGDPVEPTSRSQQLDLRAGERPAILRGGETLFWVMNDVGNVHEATGSDPLGIEVAATAFAMPQGNSPFNHVAFDQATFLRYQVTNRNAVPIEETRVSFWADPDLGNAVDDFVGIDTTRSLAYVYNADGVDDGGYGEQPPALGVDLLRSSSAGTFVAPINGSPAGDPRTAEEIDRVMRGLWKDGTPMTTLGNGYMTRGEVTTFSFPGDPVTSRFWSEENNGAGRNVPADRRFVLSTGPVTLAPGASRVVDFAILFARGTDRLASVTKLREASDTVQALYDAGGLFPSARGAVASGPPLEVMPPAAVSPNPVSRVASVSYGLGAPGAVRLSVRDVLGREVAVLVDDDRPAGPAEAQFDASRLAAGVYVVVLQTPSGQAVRTITVVR